MKIGLLGVSKIAQQAIIDPARSMPEVKLAGIAARDPQRAQAFAQEHKIRQCFDSYQALLDSPDIDLVYCALPISHHAHWTIKALEAGKHVLCEKPFAMNAGEAKRMVDAAAHNERRVIEAFHYAYHPAFATLLDWLKRAAIGTLKTIEAEFSAPIPEDAGDIRYQAALGGGAMMDLGCYPLSWIAAVMDGQEPQHVQAQARINEYGVDGRVDATLEYADGTIARASAAMGNNVEIAIRLEITGTNGVISFGNPLVPHRGGSLELRRGGEIVERAPISLIGTYSYQLAEVVRALRDNLPLRHEGNWILGQQQLLDRVYTAAGHAGLRDSTYFSLQS